jgi:hypothetical protein
MKTTKQMQSADNRALPQWTNELLASCPKAGNGVHHWLFVTALKLHRYFPDKDELERLLDMATRKCGREVTATEIENAVSNSQRVIENPTGQTQPVHIWPASNEEQLQAVVRDGPTFAQLADLSPVQWRDNARHTEEIIDLLFPGNPLLCAGPKQSFSLTRTRDEWCGFLEKQQFIVPSPMSATHGMTLSGKRSMRTIENTGPRRFLIVEFDRGTFDQHAAVLLHLAIYAPLVMVVHSGNKSAHGWFFCAGGQESVVERFFRYAVSLGADPATWTRCQFVRMPDGQRDNGKRQSVIYFNPSLINE